MGLFDDYFSDLQENYASWPRTFGRNWFKTHKHPSSLYKILTHLPKQAKVLDVGCGPGNTLQIFREARNDLELSGIDFQIAPETRDTPNLNLVQADVIKGLPFTRHCFDLVTCYFVLEHIHLSDLEVFCENLTALVKPGGYLFLTVPNQWSIWLDFYDDPTHVRPYTVEAMVRLFLPLGIETHQLGKDRSWKILMLSPFYWLYCKLIGKKSVINFFGVHLLGSNSYLLGRKIESADKFSGAQE